MLAGIAGSNPVGAWILSLVSVVFVSATGRSFVQRNPTECVCVCVCLSMISSVHLFVYYLSVNIPAMHVYRIY